MKGHFSRKYIYTLSMTSFMLTVLSHPLLAGKEDGVFPEGEVSQGPSLRATPIPTEAQEAERAGAPLSSVKTLLDISQHQPMDQQLTKFSVLVDVLSQNPTHQNKKALKEASEALQWRLQQASGLTWFNTSWGIPNSAGRRLSQSFLKSRQEYYTNRSIQEQATEAGQETRSTPLPSTYSQALAEAYGPKRAQRLLRQQPGAFEHAGVGSRFISLKNPEVLFPSSDPGLTPLWTQALPIFQKINEALKEESGQAASIAALGPIFLAGTEEFHYSDEDLKTFDTFKETYNITPPDRRFPPEVLPIEETDEEGPTEEDEIPELVSDEREKTETPSQAPSSSSAPDSIGTTGTPEPIQSSQNVSILTQEPVASGSNNPTYTWTTLSSAPLNVNSESVNVEAHAPSTETLPSTVASFASAPPAPVSLVASEFPSTSPPAAGEAPVLSTTSSLSEAPISFDSTLQTQTSSSTPRRRAERPALTGSSSASTTPNLDRIFGPKKKLPAWKQSLIDQLSGKNSLSSSPDGNQ